MVGVIVGRGGWVGRGGRGGWVGWAGLEEKAKCHPKRKNNNNNFGTTRPALLVKNNKAHITVIPRFFTNMQTGNYKIRTSQFLLSTVSF